MRILQEAVVAMAAGAAMFVSGGTANADFWDCVHWGQGTGHSVNEHVVNACSKGEAGQMLGCNVVLMNAGLSREDASTACTKARL
jgi:hypothetical protein